jgi:hypothetical protein
MGAPVVEDSDSPGTPSPWGPRQSEGWSTQLYWSDLGHPPPSYTGPNHRCQFRLIRIDSNRMGASRPLPVCEPNRDLGVTIAAMGTVVSLKG